MWVSLDKHTSNHNIASICISWFLPKRSKVGTSIWEGNICVRQKDCIIDGAIWINEPSYAAVSRAA